MADNDQFCAHCASVPLYNLFTGPRLSVIGDMDDAEYEGGKVQHGALSTLDQIWTNVHCPLCRMVKDCFRGWQPSMDLFAAASSICQPSEIEVQLWPHRVDAATGVQFQSFKTDELLATMLVVRLVALPHVAQEIRDQFHGPLWTSSAGIQLLSPDSIDPTRPLQNGFLAPSVDDSLGLLRTWINECEEQHHTTCHPLEVNGCGTLPDHLRAIDVRTHALVEMNPAVSRYAALSYVWGDSNAAYIDMAASLERDLTPCLPTAVPQLILDAITVCMALAIPYLWVDLYCVHQESPSLKAIEIALMGQIYRFSTITLIAGSPANRPILPPPDIPSPQQLTVAIPGSNLTLVTQPPSLVNHLSNTPWTRRSWTFQEGHLARRVVFFNPPYPITFVCGSGLFSPTFHSGPYGHSSHIPSLQLGSFSFNLVAGHEWLATSEWSFIDYARIVRNYSRRELSFESDKLNALEGCLTAIAERKGVKFLWGMPTAGFHYALLWGGEDGERRNGFPSWCWAGWAASTTTWQSPGGVRIFMVPTLTAGWLAKGGDGVWEWGGWEWRSKGTPREFQHGEMLSQPEVFLEHKEALAAVRVTGPGLEALEINSESARFWLDFKSVLPGKGCAAVCCEVLREGGVESLLDERMYHVGFSECGLYLRDRAGNLHHDTFMRVHWRWFSTRLGMPERSTGKDMFAARLPRRLSGKDVRWLMEDGLELIKIVDLELERYGLPPFRVVLCLGVDRRPNHGVGGKARRMGMFSLTGDMWEKARPEKTTVVME